MENFPNHNNTEQQSHRELSPLEWDRQCTEIWLNANVLLDFIAAARDSGTAEGGDGQKRLADNLRARVATLAREADLLP